MAQVQAGYAAALELSAARQTDAWTFIVTNGHDVVGGHAPVVAGQKQRGRPA